MMTKILITGISGFVGSSLAEYALAQNLPVSGFDLRRGSLEAEYHQGEITDRPALEDVLEKTKPGVIFHLAGMIKSPDPDALYKTNLLGTVALFDAIMKNGLRPIVVVASSSAVYGQIRRGTHQRGGGTSPCHPLCCEQGCPGDGGAQIFRRR